MARRQIRILRDSIPGKINDLTGKSANIVLRNRQVFLATILSMDNDLIVVQNHRGRKDKFELVEIDEIIIEE